MEGKNVELPNQEFKLDKLGQSFLKIQKPLLYYSRLNHLTIFSNLLIPAERLTVNTFEEHRNALKLALDAAGEKAGGANTQCYRFKQTNHQL